MSAEKHELQERATSAVAEYIAKLEAEHKDGQCAINFIRRLAECEGEPNPEEDGDSFWRCVEEARDIVRGMGL